MTRRRHLHLYPEHPGRHVLVRGTGVRELLRSHGIPGMWAPADRGALVHPDREADVLAAAKERGYAVEVHSGVRT